MSDESLSTLLSPHSYAGYGGMVADGLTPAQAFDAVAERAATPAFQAMIARFQASAVGRELLVDIRSWWDAEGLPVPWDNVLDMPQVRDASEG
ncbi:MAG: hypothetical protein H0X37_21285 [Herpetosiphonaceae bacterium]|nr:hypothetical protein [Herpetosiphonaceae bacterium]